MYRLAALRKKPCRRFKTANDLVKSPTIYWIENHRLGFSRLVHPGFGTVMNHGKRRSPVSALTVVLGRASVHPSKSRSNRLLSDRRRLSRHSEKMPKLFAGLVCRAVNFASLAE
jgi:hypothetical protein